MAKETFSDDSVENSPKNPRCQIGTKDDINSAGDTHPCSLEAGVVICRKALSEW